MTDSGPKESESNKSDDSLVAKMEARVANCDSIATDDDRGTLLEAMEVLEEGASDQLGEVERKIDSAISYIENEETEHALGAAEEAQSIASVGDPDRSSAKQVAEWIRKAHAYDRLSVVVNTVLNRLESERRDLEILTRKAKNLERERNQLQVQIESMPFLDT